MAEHEPTIPDLLTETNGNEKTKIGKKKFEDLQEKVEQLQLENEKFKIENVQLRYFIFKFFIVCEIALWLPQCQEKQK